MWNFNMPTLCVVSCFFKEKVFRTEISPTFTRMAILYLSVTQGSTMHYIVLAWRRVIERGTKDGKSQLSTNLTWMADLSHSTSSTIHSRPCTWWTKTTDQVTSANLTFLTSSEQSLCIMVLFCFWKLGRNSLWVQISRDGIYLRVYNEISFL